MRGSVTSAAKADNSHVQALLEEVTVECLRCGQPRGFTPGPRREEEAGTCPRCEYVGWAYSRDLSERTRRLFRELPLERRFRLRPV